MRRTGIGIVSSVKNSNDFLASKTRYCEHYRNTEEYCRNTGITVNGKKILLTENSNWQPRRTVEN